MKKLYALLIFIGIGFTGHAQIIPIPDANFKAKLLAAGPTNSIAVSGITNIPIDTNNNNEIEVSEALQVTGLNVSIAEIHELTGIEYFTNLRSLNCSENHIPTLNVSTMSNLKTLYCSLNLITSLDLTGLTHLVNLECAENILTQITFADATNIQNLSCRFNFLTSLDLSNLNNLHTLDFDYNQLTTINVSNLTQLTDLGCQANHFTALDLSALVNLVNLNCAFNQLTALDLVGLDAISTLNCSHNQITALDLSNLTHLSLLNCEWNQISTPLVLNGMADLHSVYCHDNSIPSFSFTDVPSLEILDCSANPITTLVTSNLPALSLLNCHDNPELTNLNIKNGSNEGFLDFSNDPNLLAICADGEQVNAVQNLITQYGYTNCQVDSLCDLASPNFDSVIAISVYPNPVKNNLSLQLTGTSKAITIYTLLGQTVLTIPNAEGISTMDVSALKTGTYFIKVTTDRGIATATFVKE